MMKQVAVLHDELKQALQKVREERAFNASEWIEKKTEMFNGYMRKCGLKGLCLFQRKRLVVFQTHTHTHSLWCRPQLCYLHSTTTTTTTTHDSLFLDHDGHGQWILCGITCITLSLYNNGNDPQ